VPAFERGTSLATLAAVVNDEPRPMRRARQLTPMITALLSKDPAARPSGPKLLAWLGWLVEVAGPAQPTEVLPAQEPGRPVALPPVAPPATPEPAGTPAPPPATAGPSEPPPATAGPSERSQEVPAFQPAQAPTWQRPAGTAPVKPPSRPLLPPAPPVRRRGGGRLLVVLALLLVGGLLLTWLANSIEADPGNHRAAPATTRSGAGATGTTERAPPTTKEPATTQAPTTATTAAPKGRLSAGWEAFTNRAGANRVGIPPGFRVRTRQRYNATVVQEQRDPRREFTVRSTNPANPLPQASRDYRAWARRNLDGFREIRYAEDQTYAGRNGAVVFEYQAVRNGRPVHVSHINVKGRIWGYNIEFIAPVGQWDSSQELARQFEQAFSPLG
jgi:hypothetical protein